MRFSYAEPIAQSRDSLTRFLGLNKTLTVGDGEFTGMLNMTGDHFPVLSPRQRRLKCHTFTKCNGIYGKNHLLWADGTGLWYNGAYVGDVEDSEKTFVGMGPYVLIFPDKKVFHTEQMTLTSMEHTYTTVGDTLYELCSREGVTYDYIAGTLAPDNPENGDWWMDTGGEENVLKRYSKGQEEWTAVASPTYVKLSAVGLGADFRQYDAVSISGAQEAAFNGDFIVEVRGDDFIVIPGTLSDSVNQTTPITLSRSVPDMDFFTECNNRVWGCSSQTHEIYACRLGDPYNWRAYEGLSSDSYAVTVGTDGDFTGAATYQGFPLFFKENAIHKIYGARPSDFSAAAAPLRGVQKGCSKSLCCVGEILLYKTPGGVAAYDGTAVQDISAPLGKVEYFGAAAGTAGSKYYLSVLDGENHFHMFVFDVKTGLWHEEDDSQARWFTKCQSDTFFVAGQELYAVTRGEKALAFLEQEEPPVLWQAETGDILALMPDRKFISKMEIRLQMEEGASFQLHVQYDASGVWEQMAALNAATKKRAMNVPVLPRRCDYFRLRLSGQGGVKIFALTKTLEKGSDQLWQP